MFRYTISALLLLGLVMAGNGQQKQPPAKTAEPKSLEPKSLEPKTQEKDAGKPNNPGTQAGTPATTPAADQNVEKKVNFTFWNVENLFDDKDDPRNSTDEPYDNPFAKDGKLRQMKLDNLSEIILKMNNGKGPDILACAEVESIRAAELLMATLNKNMKNPNDKYKTVLMKNLDAGRHISTCVITRLEVSQASTKLHGRDLRILETHIYANGHDLCILATHWTSQRKQDDGGSGDSGRNKYARTVYELYEKLAEKNPDTDFLVCGDFNDTPDAEAISKGLNTVKDPKKISKSKTNPQMVNLMANRDSKKFGTIWYNNESLIYDHIVASAGMFDDDGWNCDYDSVKTISEGLIRPGGTRRQPWRFGDPDWNLREDDRGYSDHFPVSVNLKVAPKKAAPAPAPAPMKK